MRRSRPLLYIIALRLRYIPYSYPGAASLLTLSSVSRMMTSGSLRSSRRLLTELLPPLWLLCQGAVLPVSDVADAVAVAVAVAVEARSGRRRGVPAAIPRSARSKRCASR